MTIRARFKALAGGVASIEVNDEIDRYGMCNARSMRQALAQAKGAKGLHVTVHSEGGDVFEGFAMYNMLKAFDGRKVIEVGGVAASMASVIAMAGDEIIMPENSWMMIHKPWAGSVGEDTDMIKMAGILAGMGEQIANIYAARTGQELASVQAAMSAETWMTAAEALKLGYCTKVTASVKLAARINTRRFEKAPEAVRRAKPKGQAMDPEILSQLGLADDATLEDVIAAIKLLQDAAAPDDGDGDPPADGEPPPDSDKDKDAQAKARARAKRERDAALATGSNSAILNAIKGLVSKVEGIGARVDGDERTRIISANARKFTPKTEKQAQKWPLDMLREFVKDAPDLYEEDEEPLETGARGATRGAKEIALTAADLAVCKATGRKPADFLAYKKKLEEKKAAG